MSKVKENLERIRQERDGSERLASAYHRQCRDTEGALMQERVSVLQWVLDLDWGEE